MNDHAGFIDAICSDPEDIQARLIYADWLEERGDPRGEFIRVQCELAACDGVPCKEGCEAYNVKMAEYRVIWWCGECQRRKHLKGREFSLFESLGANPFGLGHCISTVTIDPKKIATHSHWTQCLVRRGFTEVIMLTIKDWLAHGPQIVRQTPVTEVWLNDMEPTDVTYVAGWTWMQGTLGAPSHVPPELFYRMGGAWYPTEQEARAGLGRSALAWAREKAGMVGVKERANSI